ncbi:hypothetical protein QQF64_008565 [Cirrhinus molitorella]|uniref:Uncharacterized protein n=1 Tax=Cirrhinus molitorella TaxID=172907 RepID=A0ABR3M6H4_9TELE
MPLTLAFIQYSGALHADFNLSFCFSPLEFFPPLSPSIADSSLPSLSKVQQSNGLPKFRRQRSETLKGIAPSQITG